MALRYGGRFEIAGGNECLVLPAYDSEEFLERQAFQRESADSRRAPEFLMRDVLVRGRSEEPGPPPSSILPLQSPMAASQGMAWVFALAGVAKLLRETMAPVGWELLRLRDGLTPRESVGATHGDDLRQALQRVTSVEQKLIPVQELFEELAALADLPQDEFPQAVDLRLAVEGAISHAKSRADRRGVRLRGPERSDGRGDDFFKVVVPPKAMEGVVRWAVASAVVVASPGSTVAATLTVPDDVEASTLVLRVSATGSVSPEAKAASTGDLEVTPQLLSQSGGLELAVLRAMAERYRVPVTVEAGADGQLRLAIMARR
jgi:hypothetical protein